MSNRCWMALAVTTLSKYGSRELWNSTDAATCPACLLPQGQPLRLSPLGSQHRLGHSSQPPPPAGLAEERAAGLRVFAPQQPPPTQV